MPSFYTYKYGRHSVNDNNVTAIVVTWDPNSFETNFMKRAMFENAVINLVSSLEATAHVINQIYNLGIDYKQVILDHKYYSNAEKHLQASGYCLRCKLNDINPSLASFILSKDSKSDRCRTFTKYGASIKDITNLR